MKRLSFYTKIFAAFIGLAVVPLAIHVLYMSHGLRKSHSYLREKAAMALNGQTSYLLLKTAEFTADKVSMFLMDIENCLNTLVLAEPSESVYREFYDTHHKTVWGVEKGIEYRRELPIFKEIAFITPDGMEKIKIRDGKLSDSLKNVSDPKNTEFLTEDYFSKTLALKPEEIYVSRLSGFHAKNGRTYSGVIRFGKKVVRNGRLVGIIVASLDQTHLYEIVKHLLPTGDLSAETPYETGSYSFLFDDEGFVIAHPRQEDIRGFDKDGRLPDSYTNASAESEIKSGTIPFNLLYAGSIHKNYPLAASSVRIGRSGVTDVTNVGGTEKMLAYAPIRFSDGEYKSRNIFGGVAIGAEAEQFHSAAKVTSETIRFAFSSYIKRSWAFVSVILLISAYVSYRLAKSITSPVSQLSEGTKEMARGRFDTRVQVKGRGVLAQLSRSFNTMAEELGRQRSSLEDFVVELEKSRRDLLWEQVFKTTVFENIDTGVITIDSLDRVTFMNAAAREIFSIVLFEEDMPLHALIEKFPEMSETAAADKNGRYTGYVEAMRNGVRKTFRTSVIPISVGSYFGRILTFDDLTERMELRGRMERMERLASLGRLSAGLAHEIRNPLTGVSLLMDDMHDRLLDRPAEQDLIRRALSEIERLEGLVNELLNFARVPEMNLKPGSIAKIIEDVLFMTEKQCAARGIELVKELEQLPDIPLDESKIKQAMLNIISNAMDAMQTGGKLTVSARAGENAVTVSVKDTGEGIPDDKIPFIFEPFFTTKGTGTGLGLAITHNIITDHHGRIEVKTGVGEGTEFILSFPLKKQYGENPPHHS